MHLEHLPRSPQSDDLALNVSYPKVHKPCSCLLRERQALNPLSFAENASVRASSKGSPLAFSTARSAGLIILLSSSAASAG
jgi:hypothetical protein